MIGIIPAGGHATRIFGIPKYLLPTPQGTLISILCQRMQLVKLRQTIIMAKGINTAVLRQTVLPEVAIIDRDDHSMAHAVMLAQDYARDSEAAIFGMPDTYFDDEQAFIKLDVALRSGADVAVGIFRTQAEQRRKLGMCEFDGSHIVSVIDKPERSDLEYAWGVLAWAPAFRQFMHEDDPHVGYALPRAIRAGVNVCAVKMEGSYYDCGTPNEYFDCIRALVGEGVTA